MPGVPTEDADTRSAFRSLAASAALEGPHGPVGRLQRHLACAEAAGGAAEGALRNDRRLRPYAWQGRSLKEALPLTLDEGPAQPPVPEPEPKQLLHTPTAVRARTEAPASMPLHEGGTSRDAGTPTGCGLLADPPERPAPRGDAGRTAQRLTLGARVCSLDDHTGLGTCSCGGGIPRRDIERWCGHVTAELQAILGAVEAKLTHYRSQIMKRSATIKRLYWRLQCMELLPGTSASRSSGGFSALGSPFNGSSSHRPSGSAAAAPAHLGSPVTGTRSLPLPAGEGAPRAGGSLSPARAGATADPAGGSSSSARVRPGYTAEDKTQQLRARRHSGASEGSGSNTATASVAAASPGVAQSCMVSPQPAQPRKPRVREGGPEHTQLLHLRQELAQLKRQNADLNEQVRARDMQVDNLTGMIREMQATAQRQLGLCRRQLSIRDDTLHAMQEELLSRGSSASGSGTAAASAGPSSDAGTGAERRGSAAGAVGGSRQPHGELAPSMQLTAARGSGGSLQAPRGARRAVADGSVSERGSSVTRSSSALSRHKDQTATRRASFAPPLSTASSGQTIRTFSPRILHQSQQLPLQTAVALHGGGRERERPTPAQAVPQSGHEMETMRRIAAVATLPQGASPSSPGAPARGLLAPGPPMTRSSSADVRARVRTTATKRATRRQ